MQKVYQKFHSLFTGRFRFASVLSISLLAMLLLQVAGASAKSISQDPVYYACANYKTGKIYVIQQNGTCKAGYTLIQWNQTGPQGSQGPQGPQGPAGVSQGYFNANGKVNISNGNLTAVVVTAPVAGGTYIVNATEMAVVDTGDTVACIVASVGGASGNLFGTVGPVSNQQYSTIAVTDTVSVGAGDQIELLCIGYNKDANTYSYNAGITAIQLNAVNSNAHPMGHKLTPPSLPHH